MFAEFLIAAVFISPGRATIPAVVHQHSDKQDDDDDENRPRPIAIHAAYPTPGVKPLTTIVLVKVRCPMGHALPVSVESGAFVTYRCRSCGREYQGRVG